MKNYNKKNIFLIVFILLYGCSYDSNQKQTELQEKKENEYYNLIYSIAFGQADLICNTCDTEKNYDYIKNKLKINEKRIEVESLNILMTKHHLEYSVDVQGPYKEALDENGGTFPIKICYIEDYNSDFKYAFALNDEYYYYLLYNDTFKTDNKRLKETLKYKLVFENQLNYIISQLGINKKEHLEHLKKFIDIFFIKLLEREEITSEFNINQLLGLENYSKSDTCANNIEANIIQLFKELNQNDKVKYFNCFDGIQAFWRIEIIENGDKLKLKTSLHNVECFDTILL